MWTFDNFPLETVNEAYGLTLDQAWLDHIQAASVRLSSGCSAGVVSSDGLLLTNHHCVIECAQELSSAEKDFVAQGFLTAKREEELVCPGMAAAILTDISDVTRDVVAATQGLTGDNFVHAQNARATGIEQAACGDDPKRHCQVVPLYQGGQYKLYQYRKYSDVRLVFAPEFSMAFFGGDPDNFNFPRYALDVGFLRLYDDGNPAATPDHLEWTTRQPEAGEPIFAAGSPGKTERFLTVSQLETQRDVYLPLQMAMKAELRGRLIGLSERGPEYKRVATDWLFSVENGFKSGVGQALALRRPPLFDAKRAEEKRLRKSLKGDLKREIGDPWADIAAAQAEYRRLFLPWYFLEQAPHHSSLFFYARYLVRAAEEREKPSAERLPEFADSRLPWMRDKILAPYKVEKALDELLLGFTLSKSREYLGVDAPETRLLLGKASPEILAHYLVDNSQLGDVAVRRTLWEGGLAAIEASDDPMIQYAMHLDAEARARRAEWEDKVVAPTRIAHEKIARVRFHVYGGTMAPDATFTPRLSYGRVEGWRYNGTDIQPFTYMKGLYERATGQAPFQLSPRFTAAQAVADGGIVYNFTTTNDIAGGSSGSPAIDADGRLIGTVFDSNIHGLGGAYSYNAELNRTVVVSTAAISEVLETVYGVTTLTDELSASAN
ncbi:peptidase S46 family protein [Asticcacaulis biprosthecium C19]|uniref:Dipeptidyl-peptidase n=1 Tax=Asticcacaulis biprosthecium C19 TaxID=715226 RepID=F4QRC2_9CAUL|nr:S46 family peptidase [Asticcacaulis biprosthecium]EGF90759.1 peptidase S46 family protein [Asticcacaulis biprosthecium C19]